MFVPSAADTPQWVVSHALLLFTAFQERMLCGHLSVLWRSQFLSSQRRVERHEKLKKKFIWQDRHSKERLQWAAPKAGGSTVGPVSLVLKFL